MGNKKMPNDLKTIFEAEKKWILSGNKDLDTLYYYCGKTSKTLRDMLNDIDECNDEAITIAKIILNLTCEMFIKPTKLIDEVRKEEREKDINAFVKAIEGHKIIDGEYYSLILLNKFKELLNSAK